ncbi:flocculation protein FLO11-like [Mizuhopecten yessoensis]|uniref:flocculation protein FLO11-like n=1 Tax=Mizuhopecten yessoensis TaxID=6573 RepID=UPI000B45965D|nr:flocculation protein FLO11-like [Mizuhopecten yessoensis]
MIERASGIQHFGSRFQTGYSKTCAVDPSSERVENAALNKPATQISTYFKGVASHAVDGDKNPLFWNGSCSHTRWKEGLPLYQWWMVDLEREYRIDSVNITNRLKSAKRLRDFDIFVSLNSTFEVDDHMTDERLCIHVSGGMGGGETRTFTCQTPIFGQFIQIYMETLDKRNMNICEVTVEGYVAVCIEDITTETSLTTTNASAVITTPTATSTALSTTTQTTSVSLTIPITTDATLWKTTTPTKPKTTSAVAATTPTNTTTTETGEITRTTSTSASTTTEITSVSSTIPTATSTTTTATTIWNRTSPLPVPTTLKTVATTTAVTTSASKTLSTLVSLPGNTTTVATSTCPCVCVVSSNTTNLTQEARLELVKELRKELTVDRKETSISKRKLISVGDERQSAETIGFIGVLALCVPVLLIVSFDLINLWSSAKQKKNRVITK